MPSMAPSLLRTVKEAFPGLVSSYLSTPGTPLHVAKSGVKLLQKESVAAVNNLPKTIASIPSSPLLPLGISLPGAVGTNIGKVLGTLGSGFMAGLNQTLELPGEKPPADAGQIPGSVIGALTSPLDAAFEGATDEGSQQIEEFDWMSLLASGAALQQPGNVTTAGSPIYDDSGMFLQELNAMQDLLGTLPNMAAVGSAGVETSAIGPAFPYFDYPYEMYVPQMYDQSGYSALIAGGYDGEYVDDEMYGPGWLKAQSAKTLEGW